jgi:hypothetical protein
LGSIAHDDVSLSLTDSPPPFFVATQTPQQAPILVTPTPFTRPTTPSPITRPAPTPTRRPTLRPVTESPTKIPTGKPTTMPIEVQSDSPTMKPTLRPSDPPTKSPTVVPTVSAAPTSVTSKPTVSPEPTPFPTLLPTVTEPAKKPTGKPANVRATSSPSRSPSTSPQSDLVSVVAILSRANGKLEGKAAIDFESVTEAFILSQFRNLDLEVPVVFNQVDVNVYSQAIDRSNNRRRQLQSDAGLVDIRVEYNALIIYQTEKQDYKAEEWIVKAFNDQSKRDLYISQLQSANSAAFGTVENVVLLVDGAELPEDTTTKVDNKSGVFDDQTLWIIIGAVGGSISLVIIISALYAMGKNRRKQEELETATSNRGRVGGNKQTLTADTKNLRHQLSYDSDLSASNKLAFAAEIDVDFHNDDVSTLGDPTYYGGATDQRTASVGGPASNYSNNIADSRERLLSDDEDDVVLFSESNLSKQNDDIVVHTVLDIDDDDNNARLSAATKGGSKYAVEVPPGKLGMIIDSPDNGPPIVHTIKPESILCATVQAGDLLISVDNENVTHMTAVQVSKLISLKSDQQRTLIFLRKNNRERFNSTSSEYIEQNGAC